jgi:hypothetical protein
VWRAGADGASSHPQPAVVVGCLVPQHACRERQDVDPRQQWPRVLEARVLKRPAQDVCNASVSGFPLEWLQSCDAKLALATRRRGRAKLANFFLTLPKLVAD